MGEGEEAKTVPAPKTLAGHVLSPREGEESPLPEGCKCTSLGARGRIVMRNATKCPLAGHSDKVTGLAFSLDGKSLCSASLDNTVRVWDLATMAEVHCLKGGFRIPGDGRSLGCGFSADGTRVLSWPSSGSESFDGEMECGLQANLFAVWDLAHPGHEPEKEIMDLRLPIGDLHELDLSNPRVYEEFGEYMEKGRTFCEVLHYDDDGGAYVVALFFNTVHVWDLDSCGTTEQWEIGPGVESCCLSPNGSLLVAGRKGRLEVWDMEAGELLEIIGEAGKMNTRPGAYACSNEGYIAHAQSGHVEVWSVDDGTIVWENQPSAAPEAAAPQDATPLLPVEALSFRPDGRAIVGFGREPSSQDAEAPPRQLVLLL